MNSGNIAEKCEQMLVTYSWSDTCCEHMIWRIDTFWFC